MFSKKTTVLISIFLFLPNALRAELLIHVLDVRFGNAVQLETTSNHFLIDTGPKEATSIVLQSFAERSVTSLAAIFLTNMSAKNAGGLLKIIQQINTTEIYWNDQLPPDEDMVEMITDAERVTEFHPMKPGLRLPLDGEFVLTALP